MRFLITSTPKFPIPPQAVPMMLGAMRQWAKRHTESKKLEQTWGFVSGGGGGIVNVASHEELNDLLSEMPFTPFAETTVQPLIPLEAGLKSFEDAMTRMQGA